MISPSRTSAARPTAYCTSRGWEIVADYVEPGVSATDDRRPEFQRMIDAATTKPPAFGVIVVHSFSRFFRDQFQLEFYVRRLAKNGVRLVSITQELGDDPDEQHDPADHGAVRRVPVQGERQAHVAGHEGERPPGLLERLPAADRLPHRGGRRAARPPHQEDLGDRSLPGRDRAADLPPGARGRWRHRPDGRQVDHQAPQRSRHPYPRWRALGYRRRPQGADTHDLCRSPPLQHQVLEDARAQAGHRSRRDDGPADNRRGRVRGRASAAQVSQPGTDGAAYYQRSDPPYGHLLLRRLRHGHDACAPARAAGIATTPARPRPARARPAAWAARSRWRSSIHSSPTTSSGAFCSRAASRKS